MASPAIWVNAKHLEALEVMLGLSLAVFLAWVQTNVPEVASTAGIFLTLIILSGIMYAAKKFPTLQTVGFGKSNEVALTAAGVGVILGFLLTRSNFSLFNAVGSPEILGVKSLLVFVGVVAPLAEETFFRGSLQPTLAELLRDSNLAVFLQAAVFGAFHFLVSNGNLGVLLASAFFGLVAGYGNIFFQSTAFSYAAHLMNNLRVLRVF